MIQGFDADDSFRDIGLIAFEIRGQFLLRARRARDQDAGRRGDAFGDTLEEGLVDGYVSAVSRVGFVMNVLMWMSAVNRGGRDISFVELKYFSLLMVDPNDCVIRVRHDVPAGLMMRVSIG